MNVRLWIPFAAMGVALAQGPAPDQQPQQPRPTQFQQQPRMQPRPQPQMQPQPQPQPDFAALKGYLNLSDAQIRRIQQAGEKARKDAADKEQSLRPQIRDKQIALGDLLDKDNADATQVGRAILEIRNLEKQIRQAREAVRSSELSVLTEEQRTKFKAIQDAANLPAATREAQRLGLVPGPPPGQRPMGPGWGPPQGPPPGAPRGPMQPPPPGHPGPGGDRY